MNRVENEEAVALIRGCQESAPTDENLTARDAAFVDWKEDTRTTIRHIFGEDDPLVSEFDDIEFRAVGWASYGENAGQRALQGGLVHARAKLKAMETQLKLSLPPANRVSTTSQTPATQDGTAKVFVVHGRDLGRRDAVARLIEQVGLEAVVLQEQPSQGRTIIEKFEDHADVGFAIVLCTGDDVGALASEQQHGLRPRPRQNVVLEWGFFLGKLGRNRVCALIEDQVEIPSDYDGVVYIQIDSEEAWKLKLGQEIRAAGLPFDLNRI